MSTAKKKCSNYTSEKVHLIWPRKMKKSNNLYIDQERGKKESKTRIIEHPNAWLLFEI